jgi:hypothetical protein
MRIIHKRSSVARRRGAVFVLFALFVFVLLGLTALTVDMGLARVTQVEMQNAADSAALEGLRGRDYADADPELTRRESAAELTSWCFDDDLGATSTDALHLGAGPTFVLSGGSGGSNASQFLDVSASSVYKPALQLNLGNEIHGDMVAGDPLFSTSPSYLLENNDYVRSDFDTQDLNGNGKLDAFLVRLRRTRDAQGLDQVPGVSSKGPTLPFLFGLASFLTPSSGSNYDPSFDGISVRATSIAAAGQVFDQTGIPVVSVGQVMSCGLEVPSPVAPTLPRLGSAPFTLLRTFFVSSINPMSITYDATTGLLSVANGPFSGAPVGRFAPITFVGQVIPAPGAPPGQDGPARVVYLPVYDLVGSRALCVGFGYAKIILQTGSTSILCTRLEPIIAPQNASASLPRGFAGLTSGELADVHAARVEFDPWSLRAPVLVR